MLNEEVGVVVERLTLRYNTETILRDIDLQLPINGISTIVGRSGSGKSSLLRSLNRLNDCFPGMSSTGRVLVMLGGKLCDVHSDINHVCELRRRVGMLFQSPNVLPVSIEKNIAIPLRCVLGISKKEISPLIEESLRQVHLWDEVCARLKDPARTLSGGQQQRLCLARALALGPEVLLLDEPTASLDHTSAHCIEQLLFELKSRYTIVAVSHCLDQVQRIADTIVVMKDGSISCVMNNESNDGTKQFIMSPEVIY